MKTQDLIVESYLLVTAFALFGIGMFGLFGYAVGHQDDPLLLVLLPDAAMCAVLLGGLVLGTLRQARSFILLCAVLLTTICLYTLIHNYWAGDSETGQSWLSGSVRMRSELALVGIAATLGTGLSLWGRLARYTAQAIGIVIVLLGIILLLADFSTELNVFRLSFKPSSKNLMNSFIITLGISVILLAQESMRARQKGTTQFPIAGFIVVLFTCFGWYLTSSQNIDSMNRESNLLLAKTKVIIERTKTDHLSLIQRMSERLQTLGDLPPVVLRQQEFYSYLRDFPELGLIAILDQDFTPLYQQSRNQQQLMWLSSFLADNDNLVWLENVFKEDGAHFSQVHARAGEVASAMIASRIILPGRAPLLLVASLDIRETMWSLKDQRSTDFDLRLYEEGIEIFSSVTEQSPRSFNDVGAIDIPMNENKAWVLVSSVRRAHFATRSAFVPMLTLLFGLFLSGLFLMSRRLLEVDAKRADAIQALNVELQAALLQKNNLQTLNRRIMDVSKDVLCSIDKQGCFVELSPSCEQMFGYTTEELMGRPYAELLLPEDRTSTEAEAAEAFLGKTTHNFRNRYRHRDGRIIHLAWAAYTSADDETLLCVIHDITSLVRIETYVEAQRDILSLIVEDRPETDILEAVCFMVENLEPETLCSILLLDDAGIHLHTAAAPGLSDAYKHAIDGMAIGANAGSCGTAAYRRQLVVVEDITTDPLWDDYRELALADNLQACWSYPLLTPDGNVLGTFALYSNLPSTPSQEQINSLETAAKLATIAIIRTRDRQTLQTSEQRFRSLFIFNPDAVYSFDFDGNVQLANDATQTLIGLHDAPIINRNISDFIFAEDLKLTQHFFADACKGIPQRYETRIIDSRGKLYYLDVSNLPIIIEGQVVGVFGIAKDITQSKETTLALLHELTKAERRAAQLQGLSEAAIACGRCLSRADLIEYVLNQIGDVILVDQVVFITQEDMSDQPKTNMWLSSDFSATYGHLSQTVDVNLLRFLTGIGKPICLTQSEIETDPHWAAIVSGLSKSGHPPLRGLILVPLLEPDSSHLNVLVLSNKQQADFDQDDLAIVVQFAQMAVSSLAHIRLLEEIFTNKNLLKSQLAFTSAITESLSEGVIAVDTAGHITFVNPAAEVLLGEETQLLVGQPLGAVLPLDPIFWHSQNEQAVEGEFILTKGDNRILLYNARPLRVDIYSSGWVVALKDITAQRLGDVALHERNQVFDVSLDMLCMLSIEGDLIDVNPALINMLHYPRDQIIGMPYTSLVHAEDRLLAGNAIAQLRLGHAIRELVVRVWDSQRAMHWLQVSAVIGENKVIYGAAQDITLRRESDNQLRLFKRSVESSHNGVVIVDALSEDMPIIYINAGCERITGYSSNEVVGRNCRFLQGNDRDQPGLHIIREGLVKKIETNTVLRNFRKDGKPFWNDLSLSPIHNDKGVITHYVGIQNDISEERRVQEELRFNASHDLLTGLANRRLLMDRMSQACDVSKRYGRYIAVMFIDLDGFKQINDAFGHFSGDEVLKEAASRLMEQVRAGDSVARIGGDEFVVLLPDLAQGDDVLPVVERILLTLAKPYQIDGALFQTSASIGITLSDGNVERPMDLIQQADIAMYKAKQEGRNNYQWFTNDLSQSILERVDLRRELQQAIENQDFELYYQPQIDSRNGMVVGMEALIRWNHAVKGFISPIKFISVAEETGQIVPLSLWIFETACRHIRLLADQGMSKLSVAVNVSPIHFRRKDFLENIVTVLTRNKVNPEQLELEITESVLLKDTEQTIETFHKLKLLGIRIALDDFGTGYSSLSYLKRLPLNKVKIDRSFIMDIVSNSDDAAITKGIISMAHHLRMKVIAEGVENEFQCAFLRKANCDVFQGYYFARPMPFAELQIFLRERMLTWVPDLLPIKDNEYQQTLLLLDDEENILRALTRVLRRDGYKVLMATRAQDAFELLAKHDVQVIISDQRMPEMNGTEFFRRVKAMYPKTIRIVLSGYTDLNSVTEAINEGAIYKFLTKPWDDEQLRRVVAEGFKASKADLPYVS